MPPKSYDVIVIGNGFSGLTAVLELENKDNCSICVIGPEKYPRPNNGKFILSLKDEIRANPGYRRPGGELQDHFYRNGRVDEFLKLEEKARDLLYDWPEYTGIDYCEYPNSEKREEIERFVRNANKKGISVTISDVIFIGGVNSTRDLLNRLYDHLKNECSNVDVVNGLVGRVSPEEKCAVLENGDRVRYRDAVFLACGREGIAKGIFDELKAQGYIREENGEKNLLGGVVLEAPETIFPEVMNYMCEPKLTLISGRRDDVVRTYGYYPHGRVAVVDYGNGIRCVNGIMDENRRSDNTVLGIVTEIRFTEPFNDTHLYGKRLSENTLMLGGGKPIIQRLGDYEKGRRSTEKRIKNNRLVQPTLTLNDVTPGDISFAYPDRVMDNIYDGIKKLDAVIGGLAEPSTLMYAPLIILKPSRINVDPFTMRLKTDRTESEIYVLGDMNGICRGNADAIISGMIAADSFTKNRE